ncbi:hypothetical protein AAIB41_02490 [Brucella sp. BE17]|uniref:hypothetical protein n=1 Tax=Brucella sp. BE17 TaxID=3142977 RepID=UPI0031BA857A
MYQVLISFFVIFASSFASAQTPYGSCSEPAQYYQERYEKNGQVKDMVCMQKALERDLTDTSSYSCPHSAQYYQTQYEQHGRSGDLICMQKALEEELQ